ncbi:MAG: peptidoglycan-binding protein [Oscillospiraceae bacterium]|nr:peptidoglycan-binding protein [Oscillospiraceae bacterium]
MTNKQRQHLLAYLGYYKMNVDGYWASGSQEACKAFQRDRNITADGYGGPETDKQLRYAVYNELEKPEPVEDEVVVSKNETTTGTFWDEIEFFDREEFRCQCKGKYCNGFPAEPHEATLRFADAIRKRVGKPIPVNSGLRCPTWNQIQGGVYNSNHMGGGAVDLGCPSGVSPAEMWDAATAVMGQTGGIGIYGWGIHIDDGAYSRWDDR